jgi:hypothetical protein
MKKTAIGLASLIAPVVLAAFASTGCEDIADAAGDVCGPCGVVAEGDIGISGNAKLDGFFAAVSSLNSATVTINGDFEANVNALLETFGVEGMADASISAKVDALILAIKADITANVEGSLSVNYAPPQCSANVNVAVSAQAQCEAKADCEVEVDPGEVSVTCEGKCEGSCDAECTGGFECDVSAGAACSGKCEGTCEVELTAMAACEGTCKGDCSGECSAYNGDGECNGACNGTCQGSCELSGAAAAECSGTCTGSCEVTAEAECTGSAPKCAGECSGSCTGSCQGTARPPSASANCEASAECEAQASAQASANVQCTPPSLEIAFAFAADVDAEAQLQFKARLGELKVRGAAILQGFAKYTALIDGEIDGEVVFDPSPVVQITTSLEGVISAGVEGDLFADIPAGKIPCVIPAMEASVEMLGDIAGDATANIMAQGKLAGGFTTGFSD